MHCQACGGSLKHIDSRRDPDAIRRTYECANPKCKAIWLAEEKIAGPSAMRTLRTNSVYRGLASAKG